MVYLLVPGLVSRGRVLCRIAPVRACTCAWAVYVRMYLLPRYVRAATHKTCCTIKYQRPGLETGDRPAYVHGGWFPPTCGTVVYCMSGAGSQSPLR